MSRREGAEERGSIDRRPDHHPVRWVLLSGSRRGLTLLLSLLILVALLLVGTVWEIEMETLVNETRAVQSLFNTLLGGIILFVSVVLSINIAALSQEFAPLRTKQVQIEESIEIQSELEQFVDTGTSPTDIEGFFRFVLRALRTEIEELGHRSASIDDGSARREIEALVEELEANVSIVEERLGRDTSQMSAILLAGLDWDSVHHIYRARKIRAAHGLALGGSVENSMANLVEVLTAFASGQEYFTTVYFKRELRDLSSNLLVLSLPVIVFTAYVLLAIDAGLFPTATVLDVQPRLLYVSIAFVIALSPYVLLSSYMLRIVTVSKHSLSSGGFTIASEESQKRAR